MRFAATLTTVAATAALLAACGQGGSSGSGSGGGNGSAKFTAPDYSMGSASAPVKVVEYLSDTCSHCAAFDAETWPKIKAKYVDTGKVQWTIREFLTPPEQISAAGFVLARCAGKDKYWQVIESIFHSQEEMFRTQDWRGVFTKIAHSMGMSDKQFDDCMHDDKAFTDVNDRVQKAVTVDKIDGTPTIFINGKQAFQAEVSVTDLEKALEAAGAK